MNRLFRIIGGAYDICTTNCSLDCHTLMKYSTVGEGPFSSTEPPHPSLVPRARGLGTRPSLSQPVYLDLYVPPTDGLPSKSARLDGGGVLTHHAHPASAVGEEVSVSISVLFQLTKTKWFIRSKPDIAN